MTDITELMVKLKNVARHSVDGYGRQDICYNDPEGEFVFYSDYEALTEALEAAERQCKSWRYVATKNIAQRELDITALDSARRRVAELEALTAEQDRRLMSYAAIATKNAEDRTLTVKVPERCECCYSESEAAMFDSVVAEFTEKLELACAVQGIKLQIEGE